jgi:hypothetical protein
VGTEVLIGDEETAIAGGGGLTGKTHPRLLRSTTGLAAVARLAATDNILPSVSAPSMSGDDVIKSQLLGLLAAVLTGVVISTEDLDAGELSRCMGAFDQGSKVYDRRNRNGAMYRVKLSRVLLHHLGFTMQH